MKSRLFVSVSGGRTSGYMAYHLKARYSEVYDMIYGFANTGQENEETLAFVNRMDKEWGLGVVWLEAEVNPQKGEGTSHRIVDWPTASMDGRPFEDVIKKYGIPNKMYPHCTRELKEQTIRSYLNSVGWRLGNHLMAIGIRADEPQRIRANASEKGIIYPLAEFADMLATKPMINDWWDDQPFQLDLPDYRGNCKWCWKKSTPKLVRIAKETPEDFNFPLRMEEEYGVFEDGRPRHFFRNNMSAKAILEMAETARINPIPEDPDLFSGCSESCEAFGI